MLRLARVVTIDLLINRVRSTCSHRPLPAARNDMAPSNRVAPLPDSDPEGWRISLTVSGSHGPRKLTSKVVSCFPALRFDVVSPYRDSRYYGTPKPGKEKQKSDNYCSAILIVHRFRSSLSVCSFPYCVRFDARLRGKFALRGRTIKRLKR
jgi:hypothetical protein